MMRPARALCVGLAASLIAGRFDSIESYALRPDGDIDNWFNCRRPPA